jgi:hypothetical protein
MHSACQQVEESTVLNSAHSLYALPSIFLVILKHESRYFYPTEAEGGPLASDPLINSVCRDATHIPTLIYIYLIGGGVWD